MIIVNENNDYCQWKQWLLSMKTMNYCQWKQWIIVNENDELLSMKTMIIVNENDEEKDYQKISPTLLFGACSLLIDCIWPVGGCNCNCNCYWLNWLELPLDATCWLPMMPLVCCQWCHLLVGIDATDATCWGLLTIVVGFSFAFAACQHHPGSVSQWSIMLLLSFAALVYIPVLHNSIMLQRWGQRAFVG